MQEKQYQVQRRSMFTGGTQFENFLRPFSTMLAAIVSLENAKEKQYGYEWRILPVVSEIGRSKGYAGKNQRHTAVCNCHAGSSST